MNGGQEMAESMKDFEQELEASLRKLRKVISSPGQWSVWMRHELFLILNIMLRDLSVSYTHLDVYKRQECNPPLRTPPFLIISSYFSRQSLLRDLL